MNNYNSNITPKKADKYLINGEIKTWNGAFNQVYSTISTTEKYAPTFLGEVPDLT